MAASPPTPDALAQRLINQEAGAAATPDALAAVAERLHRQLRTRLVDVFGPTGFDALWARAMFLAHGALPPDARDPATPTVPLPPGVPAVGDDTTVAARETVIASFASFIALLFTFVGVPLGRSLLGQLWPALLLDELGPHTGESTQ
jgi:hypothetical protein